ncbi:MAG: hypothetical protein WKG01_12535 [Kofleriaceae bacterium]
MPSRDAQCNACGQVASAQRRRPKPPEDPRDGESWLRDGLEERDGESWLRDGLEERAGESELRDGADGRDG